MPDHSTPEPGENAPDPGDLPVTLEQLADLQAGLLDDATAALLRHRVRNDPDLARQFAALDQVRRDLAGLGADSAPDPPAEVTAQIGAALRGAQHGRTAPNRRAHAAHLPGHAARSSVRWRKAAAVAGVAALAAVIAVGAVMALDSSEQPPTPPEATAEYLKAPRHTGMPLSDRQILELLNRPPGFGSLTDPRQRAACLQGLGYAPDTPVLGAAALDDHTGPRVLLVLPATAPHSVMALLVAADCRAADAGLVTDAIIARP